MALHLLYRYRNIATPMPSLPFVLLAGVEIISEVNATTPPIDGVFNIYAKYGIAGLSLIVSVGLIWLVSKLFDRLMEQTREDREIRKTEARNQTELIHTLKDLVQELRQRTVLIHPNNEETPLGVRKYERSDPE